MILSEVCIKRPVFAWVLTLAVVLLGLVTGERLPVRQYPRAEKNHVSIEMNYYGAGPEIIENQVSRTIEEAVSGIDGVDTVESSSESDKSKVTVEIAEGKDVEVIANEIRDRLNKAREKFPKEAQEPMLTKTGSNEKSIMSLALVSTKMDESALYTYADNEIKHALESVPGVAKVDVYGAGNYEMSISLDPKKMAFYNLTVIDVMNAIRRQSIESPAGKIINNNREYVVTTVADLKEAEEFNDTPIVNKKGHIVKLRDIGNAKLDKSNKNTITRFNGETIVSLSVVSQTSANPIQVSRGIRMKFEELQKQIPADIKFSIAYDSTTFIERSLNEVYNTIFESILLVVLVVFVFLNSLRAAVVPLITVPISLIGAMFIMYMFDFTINSMTLMSMVLAIGLVVDDAIVILENVYKHIEKGLSPIRAAIDGAKEVSFAVIAMTLTLCAVYAPVALAEGETGKFLKEFSITLAGAVLLSGFIALTLSPMMCSRTLVAKDKPVSNNKYLIMLRNLAVALDAQELIQKVENGYAKLLDSVLDRKKIIVTITLLFSAFGYLVYSFMPKEQKPYQDLGMFGYEGHAPQTSTLKFTQKYVDAIDEIIGQAEEIENRHYVITNPTFDGVAVIKDRSPRSTEDVMQEISKKCEAISGIDVRFSSGRGGGDDSSKTVFFVVRGNKSHKELRELSSSLANELYASGIVQTVRSSARNEAEDYTIEVLRDKASVLNIDPQVIADTISGLIQGKVAARFKKDNKVYDVKVQIEEEFKRSPDQLTDIYIKTHDDREEFLVPIAELINVHARSGPVSIHRYNRTRANTMMPILNSATSLSDAIEIIRDIAHRTLPDDVFIEFIGETKRFLKESHTMMIIFLLAIGFIYLVMAAQFESWKDPFIIMLTVPLTLVGGVITLACINNTINMFSNIGFLTLIGLITKHGILIVDFANKLVESGKTPRAAVKEAAVKRLRPILMTTFAMVLGALPLAFARGAGCEIRIPLGAVIAGGMTIGTFFTIFFIPVVYIIFARFKKKTLTIA
ncbi:MAG: efflux RND transporter permease subunit [Holosporales bacterium]|jgi:multidrug efflux pump|nr:efflux RND transporter permease subunit [Holosporales bacterium]